MGVDDISSEFRDLLAAFVDSGVEFLVVGGYAVTAHGYMRTTKDLDVWVRPTEANALVAWKALSEFGAPLADWKLSDFTTPNQVMFMGREPERIDLLTTVSDVDFDVAWANRRYFRFGGVRAPTIGKRELLQNKAASGRHRDLDDIENLEPLPEVPNDP